MGRRNAATELECGSFVWELLQQDHAVLGRLAPRVLVTVASATCSRAHIPPSASCCGLLKRARATFQLEGQ